VGQGIVVARALGPRAYGVAGLLVSFPALVNVFFDARTFDAGVRYLSEFSERGEAARARAFVKLSLLLDIGVGAASLAVVIALASWAARAIAGAPGEAGLLVVAAAGTLLRTPALTCQAILVTLDRFRLMGTLQVGAAVARALLVLGAVAAGFGVAGVIWGAAIGFALEGVICSIISARLVRQVWEGGIVGASLSDLRSHRRDITRFLLWTDLGSTLGLAAKQVDIVAVGTFVSPVAAGYYRIATSLGSLVGVLAGPLQAVLYRRFSKLGAERDARGLALSVRRAALSICAPLAVSGLVCLPLVPTAIRLGAGAEYLPATGAAEILIGTWLVWLLFAWVRPLVLVMDHVKQYTLVSTLSAALSLMGFLVITPMFGIVGTAWVRFVVGLAMQVWFAVFLYVRFIRNEFRELVIESTSPKPSRYGVTLSKGGA
jgi:O-antigen/teichoic acid export membrane protein